MGRPFLIFTLLEQLFEKEDVFVKIPDVAVILFWSSD